MFYLSKLTYLFYDFRISVIRFPHLNRRNITLSLTKVLHHEKILMKTLTEILMVTLMRFQIKVPMETLTEVRVVPTIKVVMISPSKLLFIILTVLRVEPQIKVLMTIPTKILTFLTKTIKIPRLKLLKILTR